jgi:hypothetical protein
VDVNILKNAFKITNLKITKKCKIVIDVKFKVRVKDLLDL